MLEKKRQTERKVEKCVICKIHKSRNETAQTCDQHCAGKLAWETRQSNEILKLEPTFIQQVGRGVRKWL